jgi:molybdate transport system substrate-binding protein
LPTKLPFVVAFFLLGLSILPTACPAAPAKTAEPERLTVASAADLQFAFTEIGGLFERETGHPVTFVFGSTGLLTQQIENGAPFDLFAAANLSFINKLAEAGLVLPETITLYGRGRIVLAVNRNAEIQAATLQDLLDPKIRYVAIANPEHAPYGMASREALISAGVWEKLQAKIVLGENVRQALQFIQAGEAEAGIVALSVADVPEITWALIDDSGHTPLDQALAVVASSAHLDLARQFAAFINGPSGRPVMQKFGFTLPGEVIATPVP